MPDFGDDRVMACTPADIERWLAEFTGQTNLRFTNGQLILRDRDADITILVESLPVRRIHLMKFYDSRVRFQYPPEQTEQARAWISGFDRHTQRGGG